MVRWFTVTTFAILGFIYAVTTIALWWSNLLDGWRLSIDCFVVAVSFWIVGHELGHLWEE